MMCGRNGRGGRDKVEGKERGQMAMGRGEDGKRWMERGRGREAVGCHVQPAAAGAHGNKMEITAGLSQSNRSDTLSYRLFHLL